MAISQQMLEQDINFTDKMLSASKAESNLVSIVCSPSEIYSPIYPFSNEPLKEIYEGQDLRNKKVLTIASGGDHSLCAISHGATEIDVFDINRVTEYFVGLKLAAAKGLCFEDFCRLLNFSIDLYPKKLMALYEKIKEYLEPDVRCFWDYFYSPKNIDKLKFLAFRDYEAIVPSINSRIAYIDSKNFAKLKENLQNAKVKYIQSDVTRLPDVITKKYDHINLSNVLVCCDGKIFAFMIAAEGLKQSLKPGGSIYFLFALEEYLSENEIRFLSPLKAHSRTFDMPVSILGKREKGKVLIYNR